MKIEEVWPEWSAVGDPIGHGSYGVVYKCVCHEDNEEKYSAIKVISVPQDDINYSSLSAEKQESIKAEYKEIVDGFLNEIKILETLKGNKNIVAIEDSKVVEREDGIGWQIFIRMELLTDLEEYMEKNTFEKEDILRLGIDLCQALKACGEKNIIHRDIKPNNILVDNDGNFKLGDFGVAKQLEKTMSSMSMKGTYEYISPEVFQHKKDVSKVDIYSLAMVMYKLLNNNRLPFLDPEKQMITYGERKNAIEKRLNGERVPKIKEIDESLNRVILGALEYNVEDRSFKNIEEFEKALSKTADGKRIRKKVKRKSKFISAISIILALSIVTGVMAFYKQKGRNQALSSMNTQTSSSSTIQSTTELSTIPYLIDDSFTKYKKCDFSFVDPTEYDWYNLGSDETNDSALIYDWTYLFDEYDYNKATNKEIVQTLIPWTGYCTTYTQFFEEPTQINSIDSPDPLKKFLKFKEISDLYYKYPAKDICWIVDNIYNVEPELINNFDFEVYINPVMGWESVSTYGYDEEEYKDMLPYYYEGYYYFFSPPFGDGRQKIRVAKDGRQKLNDGRYKVKIEREIYYDSDSEEYEYTNNKEKKFEIIGEMTVGLKLINEKRYWSLYNYKNYTV